MFRHSFVLVCSAFALIVMSLVGSGTAAAAPYPAPRISQYSEDIWAVGGNSGCRGAIHVGISVDRTKPGKAFITYTPRPFVGEDRIAFSGKVRFVVHLRSTPCHRPNPLRSVAVALYYLNNSPISSAIAHDRYAKRALRPNRPKGKHLCR